MSQSDNAQMEEVKTSPTELVFSEGYIFDPVHVDADLALVHRPYADEAQLFDAWATSPIGETLRTPQGRELLRTAMRGAEQISATTRDCIEIALKLHVKKQAAVRRANLKAMKRPAPAPKTPKKERATRKRARKEDVKMEAPKLVRENTRVESSDDDSD